MRALIYLIFLLLIFSTCKKKDTAVPIVSPQVNVLISLQSSSFTLGNSAKGILDTFFLHFNKPIHVNYIKLLSNLCLPNLEYKVSVDSSTVTFYKLLCARLCNVYQFEFSVNDRDHNHLIDTVSFQYYSRKLPIDGWENSPNQTFLFVGM